MFLYKLKKISRRLQAKIGIRLLKQKKKKKILIPR